ncbi:HSF-type DNA-binding protein [Nitzschia inconspicua]|uniref:HSF-type DNA-binding protein n=1 Tax=Nitzschia inconspicua TaxID=303405 RepID=A0A9K3LYS3_9STRA|nr:HSF-type DNA-binding protein [Nitzschia inconspicua]
MTGSGVKTLPEKEMGGKEKEGNHDTEDNDGSPSKSGSIKDRPQEERLAKGFSPPSGPSSKGSLEPASPAVYSCTPASTTGALAPGRAPSSASPSRSRFPDKLHRLLDHCSNDPVESQIVSWIGNRAFKVHNAKQFASTILPRYFSTTTYKSFQRNLNLWGFTCIAKGSRRGVTFHPFFVRGNEDDLSSNMKRSGDPTKSVQQLDQRVRLSSMDSSLKSNAAGTTIPPPLSVMNPGLTSNSISALSALTSATNFPAAVAAMGAGQVVSLLQSLGLADGGAGVAAIAQTSGDTSEKPRSGRSYKSNNGSASSSPQVKKRKAAPKSGPPAKKEKQATNSLPTSSLHDQRASEVNTSHRMLGGEPWNSSESDNVITSQAGGIDIQQVLAMANQSSQPGRINIQQLLVSANAKDVAASSNAAVIPSRANTSGELSEYTRQMLQETHSYPSNDVHRLVALSNDSNINVQQLFPGTSGTHGKHLLDTSKISHFSAGNAGLLANDAVLPEFAVLLRQQQLIKQLQLEQQPSSGEGSSMAALLASLEGTRQTNRIESLLKSKMQEGRQSQEFSLDQHFFGERLVLEQAVQTVLQQPQKLSALHRLQEEQRQIAHQQDQQAQHLQKNSLQQLLQQLQGGASSLSLSSQLLPQVPEDAAAPAAAAAAAVSSPSLSMVHLAQLLQSQQYASSQAQIAAASDMTGNPPSSQLQHLLQSLVTGEVAASSTLHTAGSAGFHLEVPRHQEEQLRDISETTSQQLLQLLQAQQSEAALASRARGTGQDNNNSNNNNNNNNFR